MRDLLLVVSLWLVFSGCQSPADSQGRPSGPPPVMVDLLQVRPEPIRDIANMVGALEAAESVMIHAETTGVIASVEFTEGDRVKAGTLLFRLRDAEERARLAEAEARLTLAENDYRRASSLRTKQTMSEAELERARAELEVARARRDQQRVALDRTAIRAPFEGMLGNRMVSVGDRVDRDTDLVRLDAVDTLHLLFTLPEMALPLARVGTKLAVSVVPYPGQTFPGEVYFVAPTLEPRNRRVLVKAKVENQDGRLRPGLFANITAEIAYRDDHIVVPESAVAYDMQGSYVWRVGKDERAERSAVSLGIREKGRVEITEGLRPGETIVAVGVHKVMPGAVVRQSPKAATPAEGVKS
ncbi:MAG TPA: efflux RND transporter periplasmic adaptor subunit [Terriglobales bacterium]|nr:efflux RND transporter periplasmic adaptor subunit [Terriglobales bacterium]